MAHQHHSKNRHFNSNRPKKGPSKTRQLGVAFLIGLFCSALISNLTFLGFNQAHALRPGFDNHPAEPCVQALVRSNVFTAGDVNRRYPNGSLTQSDFASAVL